MDTKALIFDQAIFEVRYEHGYLYWDHCGKIWKSIQEKFPTLKFENVTTESAILKLQDEDITLQFSQNSINLTQQYPSDIRTLCELADVAVKNISKFLEISAFTRIGNRFRYLHRVKDSDESSKLLKQTGFFNIPENKFKKIGDTLKEPQVKFVITKSDEKGYIFNLQHVERKLNIALPKPVKADISEFISMALSIDVDFYTIKPVEESIVRPSELIKKNRSDIEFLLQELFA